MKRLIILLAVLPVMYVVAEDVEYNTGGWMDYVPDLSGSSTGWGQWFIGSYTNETGFPLMIMEFGFPCCGEPTGDYGWVVWIYESVSPPPSGGPETCDWYGSFTPVEGPGGNPQVYTYIDVSEMEEIILPDQYTMVFGYQNTQYGGQTPFNGTETWSWSDDTWYSDQANYRTAVLQFTADVWNSLDQATWGRIKSVF